MPNIRRLQPGMHWRHFTTLAHLPPAFGRLLCGFCHWQCHSLLSRGWGFVRVQVSEKGYGQVFEQDWWLLQGGWDLYHGEDGEYEEWESECQRWIICWLVSRFRQNYDCMPTVHVLQLELFKGHFETRERPRSTYESMVIKIIDKMYICCWMMSWLTPRFSLYEKSQIR